MHERCESIRKETIKLYSKQYDLELSKLEVQNQQLASQSLENAQGFDTNRPLNDGKGNVATEDATPRKNWIKVI